MNYERALLLDPGDGDIRHNLRFARNRTEDRIDTAGDLFLTQWFDAVRNIRSSNGWAVIGIVLFILFLTSVATFLFVRILWVRKSAFYAGIVLCLLMIMANIFAFSQKKRAYSQRYCHCNGRSSPGKYITRRAQQPAF